MTSARDGSMDLREFTRDAPGPRSNIWAGMILFVIIEGTVIGSLLTSYYYFRVMTRSGWPPPGIDQPELTQPAISLALLLLSVGPLMMAQRAFRKQSISGFRIALGLGITLLSVYVALAFAELFKTPFDWMTHVYGSIVWTLSGYQLLHGIGLLLFGLGVLVLGSANSKRLPRDAVLLILSLYWYFVVIASLPTYFTLYLAPYFL